MSTHQQEPDPEQSDAPRVGRPRRLTTSEVVAAAIGLADDQGLEELSMPKLAKNLGVGTMTVYGYVENKQDLLEKMAAHIFRDLRVTDHDDWQQELLAFFSDFRTAALTHPTLAGLLAAGRITIPAVFDILEALFRKMTEQRVPIQEAVRIFYAALAYTIGFVLWEIPRAHLQPEAEYADQWAELISQLEPTQFPVLTGPATEIAPTVASVDQFNWGLSKIIKA